MRDGLTRITPLTLPLIPLRLTRSGGPARFDPTLCDIARCGGTRLVPRPARSRSCLRWARSPV